ncbi:Fatty acid hydroxylase domain-containing protein 2, variant 3 [Dermatophagoides farinae]|nr:Fatty acid hydroxylase domain-containing protein 2, variant 3 [Dermatophagoides farinae]
METINLTIDNITEPYRLAVENHYESFILHRFNGDHKFANSLIGLFITIPVYWIVGTAYTFIDIYQWPKFILKYKIQMDKSQVNGKDLRRLVKQVLFNQILGISLGVSFQWLQVNHILIPQSSTRIPTISRFITEWISFILIREVLFYYTHRLCHHGYLYRHIHKRHHEWQTPIALAAIYCHPIEHAIVNTFPVLIGPYLMQSHLLVSNLWLLYTVLLTLNDHCGYHFPWSLSPVFHDFHHLKFNVNYGILGILDWLHGTDKIFRKSKYFQNHRIYFGLTPPSDYSKMN